MPKVTIVYGELEMSLQLHGCLGLHFLSSFACRLIVNSLSHLKCYLYRQLRVKAIISCAANAGLRRTFANTFLVA